MSPRGISWPGRPILPRCRAALLFFIGMVLREIAAGLACTLLHLGIGLQLLPGSGISGSNNGCYASACMDAASKVYSNWLVI
jgi:hypothetical protein